MRGLLLAIGFETLLSLSAQSPSVTLDASIFTSGFGSASSDPETSYKLEYLIGPWIGQSEASPSTVLESGIFSTPNTPPAPMPVFFPADQIDDQWQLGFFGEENARGLATADPDADGQNNQFEFLSGTDPTDPNSAFTLSIKADPTIPNKVAILFSPYRPDRKYQILSSPTIDFSNPTLSESEATENTDGVGQFDEFITQPSSYYRIQITPR